LHEALNHIKGRLEFEKEIANSARQRLDFLELGSHEASQVALIAELMDECSYRHLRLHTSLMDARNVFFAEQDRQTFVSRGATPLPNLFSDVLEPLLSAPKRVALMAIEGCDGTSEGALPVLLGVRTTEVFSLKGFVSWLLRPRREIIRTSVLDVEQIWFKEVPDTLRYPPEVQQRWQFYQQSLPIRLSTLLESATHSEETQAVLEYLSLKVLQAFEGNSITGLRADPAGLQFTHNGFWGDDLELHSEETLMPSKGIEDDFEANQ
jgi:hypothetical protein